MAGPLVKSVSPITRVSSVVSTITKLSEDTDRRLTASAGYDSFVQVHCVSARLLERPAACPVHEPLLRQDAEYLLQVVAPEGFRARERQLEGRALDVIDQDMQVVGIDQRPLGRAIEEIRRVTDHELVQRRAARHHARRPTCRPGAPRGPHAATSPRSFPDSRP